MKNKKKSKNKLDTVNVPNMVSTFKIKNFFIVIILLMLILIFRLVYLQFIDSQHLQTLAISQQTLTETISAKRGNIYDINGDTLAISYNTDKIYITPSEIETANKKIIENKTTTLEELKENIAKGVSDILELDYAELLEKLNTSTKKFVVANDVEKDKVDALKEWKNNQGFKTGVSFEETASRSYPHGSLASTVIGFTGTDNTGLYGIEFSWNSFLSGTPGKSVSLKDASQSEIANSEKTYIAAENGYDVTLTIDTNIQGIVERHLAEAVDKYECESGIAIAMDPTTGKISAMADYPNYDCNNHNTPNSVLAGNWDNLTSEEKSTALIRMWTPKAVNDTYEPGSVFKLITSSIALEENIIDAKASNIYTCTGSYYIPGEPIPIRCWAKTPHGPQSLTQALENSCNPFFMDLGLKIGVDRSYKYYDAFGLFNKTGISLSGEATGIFYDINSINQHNLAVMSFGERFNVTPISMITAISAIANGGTLVQPQIVDKITNTDTGEVTEFKPKTVRQVISKKTAEQVTSMMESVVIHGSGKSAKVEGYSIGGKSGTSEPRAGTDEGYTASFVAISPVEDTKIVLLVVLRNTHIKNHNGGQIAAPTAAKMLTEILPYMGVESGNKDTSTNSNLSEEDLY